MKFILEKLEEMRPKFEKGGPFEKFYPLYEANETFLFSPPDLTKKGPHVRDALDMKRLMSVVVLALVPCLLFGTYNIGFQALTAKGLPADVVSCILTGLRSILPIIIVSYAVGGAWEVLFSIVRKHEINEGFLVTGLLFPLTLPPTIPLWMVAVGISFGVVIGKEVFGGTGMNILNPALTARAFVFFAYPASISGDKVWTYIQPAKDKLIDGFSGATPLLAASNAVGPRAIETLEAAGFTLRDAFIGRIPGSIGEVSTLGCLIGAAILIITGIGSWRIMAACVIGAIGMSSLVANLAGPESSALMSLPYTWHLCLGGFMFGTVFMATDPVSAAGTKFGQWVYGILIGVICILVRTINPAYPEGMMLAILFMNVTAPLIDYLVIQTHFKSRAARRTARRLHA
ncbi:MAG: NADH:ubiquinone reductase (Na(+)-transporting) subunit B [Elusimicrobiota bacterium]